MIPTFALPGERTPGQFGPDQRDALRTDVRVDAQHLVRGDVLGDADDRLDAGVDGLVDRVGREPRRHEDHRRVRARLGDGVGDRVVDRHALDVLAALARRDAGDEIRAVRAVAQPVEAPFGAGQARDDELRVGVDDDRHYAAPFTPLRMILVSCQVDAVVVGHVGEQLAHALGIRARCTRCGQASRRASMRLREVLDAVDLEARRPRARRATRPRQVPDVCRVAQLLGRLDLGRRVERVLDDDAARFETRAISPTARPTSAKWCGAMRVTTTSNEPSANGMSSAKQTTSALHPGCRIRGDDLRAALAQPARDVPAAGRDVERLDALARLAQLDDDLEVGAGRMRRRRAVRLGPLAPDVAHAASSTACFAASSIVGET